MQIWQKLYRLGQVVLHYQRRALKLPYLPFRLWIEPTNQCNLKCVVCPNSTDTTSIRGNLNYALFKELVTQLQGYAYDINLSHRGESLFHPQLTDMIEACRSAGIRTRVHTNATLLTQTRAHDLITAGLDLISFSFDGFTKTTYEQIRIGACFEEVLTNIVGFLREKQRLGSKKPYTILQVIDTGKSEVNGHSSAFLRQFEGLPLDKLYVKKPHNWAGNVIPNGKEELKVTPISPSTFPWYSMTILWDGKVVPCPQDWYAECTLGDVTRQSLWEIWNGDALLHLRHRMKHLDLEGVYPCCRCDRVTRPTFLGVPYENMRSFFGETVLGYRLAQKIIKR